MCTVSTPKVSEPKPKPLPILRNPILDGMLGNIASIRNGRNAFRINLINPLTIPVNPNPASGGGSSGGGGGSTGGSTGGTTSGGGSGSGGGGTSGGFGGSFGGRTDSVAR